MHGTFIKHRNLQHFWGADRLPQFWRLELCSKDCDKENVKFRCSLAIFGDLRPSWVRMSGGKNAAKNDWFFTWRARAEKMRKIAPKHRFFCMVSCQNAVNTTVFGWFALRTGSENMKKTVVFAVHLKPLVEKTSQNTVFSTRSLKKQCKQRCFWTMFVLDAAKPS